MLTIIDRCSRYFDAIPMPKATSAQCASAFLDHWVRHFGLPRRAISDHGPAFVGKVWKDLHEKLGVIVTYSPIYRPAAVGQVERQHRDLKQGIRAVLTQMAEESQIVGRISVAFA